MNPLRCMALLSVGLLLLAGCTKKEAPAASAEQDLPQLEAVEEEPDPGYEDDEVELAEGDEELAEAPTVHDVDEETREAAPTDDEPGVAVPEDVDEDEQPEEVDEVDEAAEPEADPAEAPEHDEEAADDIE